VKIRFACPHCAKPLVADSALAGRTGRCRYCGQRTVVPAAAGGEGQIATGNQPVARDAAADWRTAVASQLPTAGRPSAATDLPAAQPAADETGGYSLRPVTPVNVPALAASEWDNAELGPAVAVPPSVFTSPASAPRPTTVTRPPARAVRPPARVVPPTPAASPMSATTIIASMKHSFSALANAVAPLAQNGTPGTSRPVPNVASSVLVAYRLFFGLMGRLTAWISETSYTVSFILIILAVASGMIGRHALATTICGAIIAINLLGLAGDIASLLTLSFRKNPLQGALFCVPPFTLYYLWTDWYRYRDTILRMRIPLLTLALVIAAYLSVPWLRGGIKAEVPAAESVTNAVDAVGETIAGQKGVLDEGLKKARSWLREVPLPDSSSLPALPGLPSMPSMPGMPGTHQAAPGARKPARGSHEPASGADEPEHGTHEPANDPKP